MHFHCYFNDISTRRILSLGLGRSIGPNWHQWTHNCWPICAFVVMRMPYLWAFSSMFTHMSHQWGLTNSTSAVWPLIKNIPTIMNYLFIAASWNSVPRSLLSIIWLRARACVFTWTRALAWKCHRSLPCSCTRRVRLWCDDTVLIVGEGEQADATGQAAFIHEPVCCCAWTWIGFSACLSACHCTSSLYF